jgi:hypothetical protein
MPQVHECTPLPFLGRPVAFSIHSLGTIFHSCRLSGLFKNACKIPPCLCVILLSQAASYPLAPRVPHRERDLPLFLVLECSLYKGVFRIVRA